MSRYIAGSLVVVASLQYLAVIAAKPATGPATRPTTGPAPIATTGPALRIPQPKVVAEFDIPRDGRLILLPVRFEGKTYKFALDTGASHCIFDESFRSRLGKPVKTGKFKTAGAPRKLRVYAAPNAFLGPVNLKESKFVVCVDMKIIRQASGLDIRGIIGMSAVRKYVLRIDFDRGRLSLFEPAYRKRPQWGRGVPIRFNEWGSPVVKARLPAGIETDFILDTCNTNSVSLSKLLFEYVVKEKGLKTDDSHIVTLGGTIRHRQARIAGVSVGDFTCKDMIIDEGNFFGLGLGWLNRFCVTFDFPGWKMYLKKGAQFNRPDEAGMAGMCVRRIDGREIVHLVYKDSPVELAGIRAGDVILTVNGKPTMSYEKWELGRLLRSKDKKKITMTIERKGKKMTVSFRLKRQI